MEKERLQKLTKSDEWQYYEARVRKYAKDLRAIAMNTAEEKQRLHYYEVAQGLDEAIESFLLEAHAKDRTET